MIRYRVLAVMAALLSQPLPGNAENNRPTASLHAAAFAGGMFAAADAEAQRTLVVDASRQVTFIVTSPAYLKVSIELPDRTILSAEQGTNERRRWYSFVRDGTAQSILVPGTAAGHNTFATIDGPPPGRYIVRLARAGVPGEAAPFSITLLQDSETRMGLVVPFRDAIREQPVVINALIFSDAKPVRGAAVTATVAREPADRTAVAAPAGEMVLTDNGSGVDTVAGDGIYSGVFTPKLATRHFVAIRATGLTPEGLPFERYSGLSMLVVDPTVHVIKVGRLTWADDDGDGRIDQLNIPIEADAPAGTYEFLGRLRAPNGTSVQSNQIVVHERVGTFGLAMGVEAARVRLLGADGPYTLESIEVFEIGDKGRQLSGRRIGEEQTPQLDLDALDGR